MFQLYNDDIIGVRYILVNKETNFSNIERILFNQFIKKDILSGSGMCYRETFSDQ